MARPTLDEIYGSQAKPSLDEIYGTQTGTLESEPQAVAPPEPSSLARRAIADPVLGLVRGAAKLPNVAVGLADIATGGKAGKFIEDTTGYDFSAADKFYNPLLTPETRAAQEEVSRAFKDDGFIAGLGSAITHPSVVAQTVAESVPSMVGGAGLARLGLKTVGAASRFAPMAVGAGEGAVTAGQIAEDIRVQNPDRELTGKQAILSALAGIGTAGLGAAGSKLANSAVGRKFGLADIDSVLAGVARETAEDATPGAFKRAAAGLIQEGLLEELPQSAQEQVLQNIAQDKPWHDGLAEAAGLGLLSGGVMGAGSSAAFGGSRSVQQAPHDEMAAAINQPQTAPLGLPYNPVINAGWEQGDRQTFREPVTGQEGREPFIPTVEGQVVQGADVHRQLAGLLNAPVIDAEIIPQPQIGYTGDVRYGDGFITAPAPPRQQLGLPAPVTTVSPDGTAITPDQMRGIIAPGLVTPGMTAAELRSSRARVKERPLAAGEDRSGIIPQPANNLLTDRTITDTLPEKTPGEGVMQQSLLTAPVASREPWEMTRNEFMGPVMSGEYPVTPEGIPYDPESKLLPSEWKQYPIIKEATKHKAAVRQALADGKPVPAEVLADYPDLQQTQGGPVLQKGEPTNAEEISTAEGQATDIRSVSAETNADETRQEDGLLASPTELPTDTAATRSSYDIAHDELDKIQPTIKPLTKAEPNHIVMDVQTMHGGKGRRIAAPYDGTEADALRVAKALKLHASEELNASMRDSAVYATDTNSQPKYAFTQGEGVTEMHTVDRRQDTTTRKRLAEMSPEEMRRELLTNHVTGIPNKRAYDEADRLGYHAAVDADSLKWVNDNMGHGAGDELLRAIGRAIADETDRGYHISGDEFIVEGVTAADTDALMERINNRLKNAEIIATAPDGTVYKWKGLEATYGTGKSLSEADGNLSVRKQERETAGQRAARGEKPAGVVTEPAAGINAESEVAEAVAPSQAPVPKPRLADTAAARSTDSKQSGAVAKVYAHSQGYPKKDGRGFVEADRDEILRAIDDAEKAGVKVKYEPAKMRTDGIPSSEVWNLSDDAGNVYTLFRDSETGRTVWKQAAIAVPSEPEPSADPSPVIKHLLTAKTSTVSMEVLRKKYGKETVKAAIDSGIVEMPPHDSSVVRLSATSTAEIDRRALKLLADTGKISAVNQKYGGAWAAGMRKRGVLTEGNKLVAPLPTRSVALFNTALADRDTAKLKEMVHPDNKTWRKMFGEATGEKLPAGVTASGKVVDKWAADGGIGREWDSPYGRQRLVKIDRTGTSPMYVVQTVGTETIRNYMDIEHTIKEDQRRLTPEYAAEVADRKETARLVEERNARQADKQKQADAEIKQFTDHAGMSDLAAGKARAALTARQKFNGVETSRKKAIEKMVKEGYMIGDWKGERTLVDTEGAFFSQSQITKTGLDYAAWLIDGKPTEPGSTVKESFIGMNRRMAGKEKMDDVILAQIKNAADEGGGWANIKGLPGGSDFVSGMIDKGILEESDGFVRFAATPAADIKHSASGLPFDSEFAKYNGVHDEITGQPDTTARYQDKSTLRDESEAYNVKLEFVEVRGENSDALRSIARAFGLRVQFYATVDGGRQGQGSEDIQRGVAGGNDVQANQTVGVDGRRKKYRAGGFVSGRVGDTIYLNARSPGNLTFVLGHEIVHQMRKNSASTYDDMLHKIEPYINKQLYDDFDTRLQQIEEYKGKDKSVRMEEFVGDVMGTMFINKDAWSLLAEKEPTIFVKIARAVIAMLNRLKGKVFIHDTEATDVITDIRVASVHMLRALIEYSKTHGDLPADMQNALPGMDMGIKHSVRQTTADLTEHATGVMDRINNWLQQPGGLGKLPFADKYLTGRYRVLGDLAKIKTDAHALFDLFKKADGPTSKAIYDYLTDRTAPLSSIPTEYRKATADAKQTVIDIGQKLVALGMLKPSTFEANKGEYLPRVYLKYLLGDEATSLLAGGKKLNLGYLKQRKDIPEDVRRLILGEVKDPGFLLAKAVSVPMRDMALVKWLGDIATNPEWVLPDTLVEWQSTPDADVQKVTPFYLRAEADRLEMQIDVMPEADQDEAKALVQRMRTTTNKALEGMPHKPADVPKAYRMIPDSAKYGLLRGLIVRKEIHNDIVGNMSISIGDAPLAERILGTGGTVSKLTGWWKWSKVAANPPAQIRNFVSNLILLHLSGIPMHRVPQRIYQAAQEIKNNGKHWQIAKQYGVTESSFANTEMARINDELLDLLGKNQEGFNGWRALKIFASKVVNKSGDMYQFMESLGKTAKIIDEMEKGAAADVAALEAHKALFDYSLVNENIRYLRNAPIGVPFLTFMTKIAPRLLDTAIHHPARYAPYVAAAYGLQYVVAAMTGIDDDDLDKIKEALPEWIRKKQHTYLLPWKDDKGRWQAVDLGYFFPWTQWTEMAALAGKGDVVDAFRATGVIGGPLPDLIAAVKTNIDPFTKRPIVDKYGTPPEQAGQLFGYLYQMAMPPWLTQRGAAGKTLSALTDEIDKQGMPRATGEQAALSGIGINTYAYDAAFTREQNIKRMQYDVSELRRQMTSELADRNLTAQKRASVRQEYMERIDVLRRKREDYAKESLPSNPRLLTSSMK